MFKIFRKLIFLILLILVCYKFIQVHHDVKQVMNYRSLVREVLDEQDTVANEELVLAMIYTETKGKVSDVMQSSESATGQTAVQAYNFGRAYIDYIAKHGGENTLDLAKKYSKNIVAPSLGNVTGKTYSYYHPIALLHGSKLYINGGNFYYSRQVRMNMYIMKVMNWF